MSDPSIPLLEVEDLTFSFGARPVLQDVRFGLDAGVFTVLLGPNGAGKTTLFSLITRLLDGAEGRIRVGGRSLHDDPAAALRRMGVVFQQPTLDLDLTVRQNLDYHGALHGLSKREARARAEIELGRLGLVDRVNERVRHLNGGHRRRVEIARALLHQPSLLLLDEPTVGLDVPSRKAIVEHVHRLARDERTAVLWATHLIDEVADEDRVLILHRGRLRADGGVADVIERAGARTLAESFDALTGAEEVA